LTIVCQPPWQVKKMLPVKTISRSAGTLLPIDQFEPGFIRQKQVLQQTDSKKGGP
jgi:hypothetical protein